MPNPDSRSSIQSIDCAAAILKALAGGPRRLGVSELADRLGLARPTVHGLLQTLASHGFVEQDRHSEKYQLGAGLLQLGYSYLDLNELRGRSIVYADRLASRTGNGHVRLADTPFVEGAVAAAVTSASGASLDEVLRAAESARGAHKL